MRATLFLNGNSFTSSIPSTFAKLHSLQYFYVNSNSLQGNLDILALADRCVDFFPVLQELDVAENAFTGSFPAALFSHPALFTLTASSNCCCGQLELNINSSKPTRLRTLQLDCLSSGLACRNYAVQLPKQLLQLANIDAGYIPFTYMTGSIPSALWSLSSLQSVSLVGNGFRGKLDLESFNPDTTSLQSVFCI